MNYFVEVVGNLTNDEMRILAILHEQGHDAKFKSVTKGSLIGESGLSVHNFKKALWRLEALYLVTILSSERQHRVFITNYGIEALDRNFNY